MTCPKCNGLTRVDLQSFFDMSGERYRRVCVACSWDVWEPEVRVDPTWASFVLALDAVEAPAITADEGREQPLAEHELLAFAL